MPEGRNESSPVGLGERFVQHMPAARAAMPAGDFRDWRAADACAGVLRWTWRVQYYAIGAFGTDNYPPFSLENDPGYPARLDVEYPEQLSRGLALVKWWLLASCSA